MCNDSDESRVRGQSRGQRCDQSRGQRCDQSRGDYGERVNSPHRLSVDGDVGGDEHHQHPQQLQGPLSERMPTTTTESVSDPAQPCGPIYQPSNEPSCAMSIDTRNDSHPLNQEPNTEKHESQARGRKRIRE
ncbi:hypothetical protein BGZ65_011293, partial [Modicella reniformis]